MADYAKIAEEAKALQTAAHTAAIAEQKQNQALNLFFKSIEISLGNEINDANPELFKQGLLVGDKIAGITKAEQIFETQITLRYGNSTLCEVSLDPDKSTVQVEMSGDADAHGMVVLQKLQFQISSSDSGMVGHKLGHKPGKVPDEFGAKNIAEVVIKGIIRGYFE
jgi:hypothetical protein